MDSPRPIVHDAFVVIRVHRIPLSTNVERIALAFTYLFGDALSAADVTAFPFLKYAAHIGPGDDETFHRVLAEQLALGDGYPRLRAWIERCDRLPRA